MEEYFFLDSSSELLLELEDCMNDGRIREEDLTSVDLTMMGALTSELLLLEVLLLLLLVRTLEVNAAATGATESLTSSTVEADEDEEVESFLSTMGCLVSPILTSVISLKLMTWWSDAEEEELSLRCSSCRKLVLLTLESSLDEEESMLCWDLFLCQPTFFLIFSIMSIDPSSLSFLSRTTDWRTTSCTVSSLLEEEEEEEDEEERFLTTEAEKAGGTMLVMICLLTSSSELEEEEEDFLTTACCFSRTAAGLMTVMLSSSEEEEEEEDEEDLLFST